MATPTASLAYAELAPHSLHLAILSGRKVVAVRAFSLDAKADLAAFVAEHKVSGVVRAALLGAKGYLHRSAEAESGAVRQPAALQSHLAKLPHGFDGAPVAAVCDAATGAALDLARATPWVLAAVDAAAFAQAKETLGTLGIAPADFTLAAPIHLGAVAASLSGDETALVLLPGDDEASLAWVSNEGVRAVATAPLGYAKIFEAVQHGLGLKFKAAAGKLFYNENYDFADAAPKIAAELAEVLKPVLAGNSANLLHIAGLTPGQSWLTKHLAESVGLKAWMPLSSALASRLSLENEVVPLPSSAAALVTLGAAGSADAAWVQPTLETILSRPSTKPKTAAPFAKPAAEAAPAAAAPAAPAKAVPPASKPAAAKPVLAKPVAAPAPKAAATPAPVESVSVEDQPAARPAGAAPRKSNKGPIFIAGGVGLVAAVVGLAMHFRSPKDRPSAQANQPAPTEAVSPAPEATQPAASPAAPRPAPTPPSVAPIPAPAPIVVTPPSGGQAPRTTTSISSGTSAADQFANDPRKFGNDRYRLEVTDKGFIQALATSRDEVLVESAAGISLQGSYVGTDGRRKWFNVGGVDDVGYQANVRKGVRDGATIFEVKVTHPRFELEQTFHCLPDTVKVSARFTPINLRDPRGVIAAVHSVRLSPVALNPSLRMRASADSFAYAMKAGTLRVGFDNAVWARDGADGKQTIIAGENGVAFHFTENTDASRNTLNYEIALP
jgi:hypothetical protein